MLCDNADAKVMILIYNPSLVTYLLLVISLFFNIC